MGSSIGLEDTPWRGWRTKTVGAPRWRSALRVAPRRRTCTLIAPRWCHVTELAPCRRRAGWAAPRWRSALRIAPRWRTCTLAAPPWRSATELAPWRHRAVRAVPRRRRARTLRHGGTCACWLHHGGVLSLKWRHVGVGLFGRRRGGALPRRPRHDGALPEGRATTAHRYVRGTTMGPATEPAPCRRRGRGRRHVASGGLEATYVHLPPQDCISGPGRGPGRLAGGVGPVTQGRRTRSIERTTGFDAGLGKLYSTATILRVFRPLVRSFEGCACVWCGQGTFVGDYITTLGYS